MPGHALSAIRAYPELGIGVAVPPGTEADRGVFPWLYNTDEATFAFLEEVPRETMALFPSRWIHVGGDEAAKDQCDRSVRLSTGGLVPIGRSFLASVRTRLRIEGPEPGSDAKPLAQGGTAGVNPVRSARQPRRRPAHISRHCRMCRR